MLRKSTNILLGIVLLLGFVLRIYQLDKTPPGLYWDEMDLGYQAYSILKTGKDYFGNTPSFVVQSFADFRAPVLVYLIIPFVAVFDLTAYAVRLPAAIFGTFIVFLIFILVKILFKNSKAALLAAALVAFSPWNIQYSRVGFEATIMLAFFLGGAISFLKGLTNPKWFLLSAVLFSVSLFTYNTAKLFVPIFICLLALIYIRKKNINKALIISLAIFAMSFILSLYGTIFLGGGQRFSQISIFSDTSIGSKTNILRHESGVAYSGHKEVGQELRLMDKFVYNKFTFLLDTISHNYLQVFSTGFLFITGDPNLRHSTGRAGAFFRIEFITIILGLFFLLYTFKKGEKSNLLLLSWILLAPIPSIITQDGSTHATRLFFLFPALSIVSALGLVFILKKLPKVPNLIFISLFTIVWVYSLIFYLNHYFGTYNLESAKAFQNGFSQAVQIGLTHKNSYDYVIIDDRRDSALMNYLFQTGYDPALFQSQISDMSFNLYQFPGDKIDNFIMLKPGVKGWKSVFKENRINNDYLLIVSSEQFQEDTVDKVSSQFTENQKLLDVIYYPSGSAAFYVIESKKPKTI